MRRTEGLVAAGAAQGRTSPLRGDDGARRNLPPAALLPASESDSDDEESQTWRLLPRGRERDAARLSDEIKVATAY